MKITMIGKSGSGKTTYMSALYERLGARSVKDFSIRPTAKSLEEGINQIGKFASISLRRPSGNYEFPAGTQQTTLWTFDLFHKNKLTCAFEWIDYRGGIFDDIASLDAQSDADKQEQIRELVGHIAVSDAVIIFADSIILSQYDAETPRRIFTGAEVINQVLQNFSAHYPKSSLTLIVVLSKADSDAVQNRFKHNNYAELILRAKEVFHETDRLVNANNPRWIGGMLPIGALGIGNTETHVTPPTSFAQPALVDTRIINFPNPMNAEHPIFFCVGESLKQHQASVQISAEYYRDCAENAMRQSDVFSRFWAFVSGEEDPARIAKRFQSQRMEELKTLLNLQEFTGPLTQASQKIIHPMGR